jgi:hypothetical protein
VDFLHRIVPVRKGNSGSPAIIREVLQIGDIGGFANPVSLQMYSFVNDLPENGMWRPKIVRGALQSNKYLLMGTFI